MSQEASNNYLKCFLDIYKTTQDIFPDVKNIAVYLTDSLYGNINGVDVKALRDEDAKRLADFPNDFIKQATIEDVKHLNDIEAELKAVSPIARALMNRILEDNMINKGFPSNASENDEDDKNNKMTYMI